MQTDETRAREVIQADRDAAGPFANCLSDMQAIFDGKADGLDVVLAFARHRATFAARPAVEREDDEPLFERIRETFRPVDYQLSCEVIDAIRRLTRLPHQADHEAIAEALTNARYALELWEREAIHAGNRLPWTERPIERGREEIARLLALSPTPSAGCDDAGHPLARMVALDEEIEAEHPGWMTGQNTLPPATEKAEK